ncbi:MAG: SRPBCC family protein [Omnitrophica WOR_2 bacterium]
MITRSIIVQASADEAYQLWHNFENFPMFMQNIKSVKM